MEKILEIVGSIMKKDVDFLKENLDTENLWNSLTRVEIFLTIEEEFDVFFSDEEIKAIQTINQLIEVVNGKE